MRNNFQGFMTKLLKKSELFFPLKEKVARIFFAAINFFKKVLYKRQKNGTI